jgi:hypothetical protein
LPSFSLCRLSPFGKNPNKREWMKNGNRRTDVAVVKSQGKFVTVDLEKMFPVSRYQHGNLGTGGFPENASVTDFFPRK